MLPFLEMPSKTPNTSMLGSCSREMSQNLLPLDSVVSEGGFEESPRRYSQMQQTQSQIEVHQLKQMLVPNFNLLDHAVQKEIIHVLDVIMAGSQKSLLQIFSRMSLLEEAPLLRSHIWKLLLETLSLDPSTWQQTKKGNREIYSTLIHKYMSQLTEEKLSKENRAGKTKTLISHQDHEFFDAVLWHQIQLDTKRTHSSLNFFQKEIEHTSVYSFKPTRNCDVLSRLLYIWGKVNPTVRYVQGMNEILAPLYYLEFQRPTEQSEAEVFFMFASLMGFVLEMHIKELDHTEQGIMGRMGCLNRYLMVVDSELWLKLEKQKIIPHYYSFRWLSLLLAQQFGLYETMKLWDILLSYEGPRRYFYLYSTCISILKFRKDYIIHGDFISILPMIQKVKDLDVYQVIQLANKLFDKYSKVSIEDVYMRLKGKIEEKNIVKESGLKNLYHGLLGAKNNIYGVTTNLIGRLNAFTRK